MAKIDVTNCIIEVDEGGGALPGTNTTAGANGLACGSGTVAGVNGLASGTNTVTGADAFATGSATTAAGAQSSASGLGTIASSSQCHAEGLTTVAGYIPVPCTIAGAAVTIPDVDVAGDFYPGSPLALTSLAGGTGPTSVLTEITAAAFVDPDTVLTLVEAVTDHTSGAANMTDYSYAAHAEGEGARASGNGAHAEGYQTLASSDASHAEGRSTVASVGYAAHAEGEESVAAYQAAHAEGVRSVSAALGAHAEGVESRAYAPGQHAFASGKFAAAGDAQGSRLAMRVETTSATPQRLTAWGGQAQAIRADTTAGFTIDLIAYQTSGDVGGQFWRRGRIRNAAGTTALRGTVATIGTDVNPDGLAVAVTADDATDSLAITVTGLAATTIRWVAVVRMVEGG